jgi:peptidoglycan/xylan/chitin deacetylase (PgdA/CDA1 family)
LVREIAARGHVIGNHTETHPNLALLSARMIEDELRKCQASINAAGAEGASAPSWMRPPFGFRGPHMAAAVRRAGLRGVAMWSMTCYDWRPQPAEKLIERLSRVGKSGKRGPVVLLHDGDFQRPAADRRHVVTALDYWLPRWRDAGLEFVTIEDAANAL